MKSRRFAIAGSIAALSLAAAPIAAAAPGPDHTLDRSRDRTQQVEKRSIDHKHVEKRSADRAER
jgi:hypothetical protein